MVTLHSAALLPVVVVMTVARECRWRSRISAMVRPAFNRTIHPICRGHPIALSRCAGVFDVLTKWPEFDSELFMNLRPQLATIAVTFLRANFQPTTSVKSPGWNSQNPDASFRLIGHLFAEMERGVPSLPRTHYQIRASERQSPLPCLKSQRWF